MQLSALLLPLKIEEYTGSLDVDITSLAYDSRRVEPGAAFVAIKGFAADGHRFIPQAIERGATAIIGEDLSLVPAGVAGVRVTDSRMALAVLSSHFYGNPSRKLKLIGVTGTNGKTTTTYLIEGIFRAAGMKTGVIGTLHTKIGDDVIPAERTTPESLDFQETLAHMVDAGVECVVMEVSSHALALKRTDGACFDAGVFTNLTQDHLDFHKDFEDYFNAKTRLFTDYPSGCYKQFSAVINTDDPYGRRLLDKSLGRIFTYAMHADALIKAVNSEVTADGVSFRAETPDGSVDLALNVGGAFNIFNALAAVGVGIAQGVNLDIIKKGLESVPSVPGRFEAVVEGQPFGVLVDYAHTPDGLENVAVSVAKLVKGRKIIVFGCGGDRDRTKRPKMGAIAANHGDVVIVTSDNPRSEDPMAIIDDIVEGIDASLRGKVVIEPDRASAIEKAITMAQPGDIVLIAGKGHETYQLFADRTIHFDDREVAREILHKLGHRVGS